VLGLALLGAVVAALLGVLANWVARPLWAEDNPNWVVAGIAGLAIVGALIAVGVSEQAHNTGADRAGPAPPFPTSTNATPSPSPGMTFPAPDCRYPIRRTGPPAPAGWSGADGWTVAGGQMHSNGQNYGNTAGMVAPLDFASIDNYAVEAEIQLLRHTDAGMISGIASFGVVTRGQDDGSGYNAGPCVSSGIFSCASNQPAQGVAGLWTDEGRTTLDVRPFQPGSDWHVYKVEVRGNTLTVSIDGYHVLSATDNTYPTGAKVGLWSDRCQINVRRFEVNPI